MSRIFFDGYNARVVIPDFKTDNPVFAVKTEYRYAFPEAEIELVKNGCAHHPHGLDDPFAIVDFIKNIVKA